MLFNVFLMEFNIALCKNVRNHVLTIIFVWPCVSESSVCVCVCVCDVFHLSFSVLSFSSINI